MKLQGQIALITGGGSSIGRAIAESPVREGAQVVIASKRLDLLERVAAELTAAGPGTATP